MFTSYVLKDGKDNPGFPKSPFNFPLLLTADEKLRIFDSQRKAVCLSPEYASLFEKCRYRFVHPELTELKYNESYFLQPLAKLSSKESRQLFSSTENWSDVKEILSAILPRSLHKVQVVDKSSKQFSHDQLKLLWQCLVNEQLFKEHLLQIVKEWAVILSTGDKLYSCPSSCSHVHQVLPMIPPTAKLCGFRIGKHSEDIEVYELLKEHGLPVLDIDVCHAEMCQNICPHFSDPKRILNTIHYLHSSGQLQSLFKPDIVDDQVQNLFTYLAGINFTKDHDALCRIKSLPLFKGGNNYYRSVNYTLYLWPEKVCMSGNDKWLHLYKDTVFLTAIGPWNSLTSDSQLGMEMMDPLTLYVDFVFPNFKHLSHKERVAHLQCIGDTEELFTALYSDSENEELKGTERNVAALKFISALKTLP